jgi:hypothetical protein
MGECHQKKLLCVPVIKNELKKFMGGIPMDENAPGHAAIDTWRKLNDLRIKLLPWPPASPDLNPIKNIWQIIKQQFCKYTPAITIIAQLQEAVQKEWDALDWYCILKLIETMLARIQAVLAAKGGHTKW